jgi:hypothetical protein
MRDSCWEPTSCALPRHAGPDRDFFGGLLFWRAAWCLNTRGRQKKSPGAPPVHLRFAKSQYGLHGLGLRGRNSVIGLYNCSLLASQSPSLLGQKVPAKKKTKDARRQTPGGGRGRHIIGHTKARLQLQLKLKQKQRYVAWSLWGVEVDIYSG